LSEGGRAVGGGIVARGRGVLTFGKGETRAKGGLNQAGFAGGFFRKCEGSS